MGGWGGWVGWVGWWGGDASAGGDLGAHLPPGTGGDRAETNELGHHQGAHEDEVARVRVPVQIPQSLCLPNLSAPMPSPCRPLFVVWVRPLFGLTKEQRHLFRGTPCLRQARPVRDFKEQSSCLPFGSETKLFGPSQPPIQNDLLCKNTGSKAAYSKKKKGKKRKKQGPPITSRVAFRTLRGRRNIFAGCPVSRNWTM